MIHQHSLSAYHQRYVNHCEKDDNGRLDICLMTDHALLCCSTQLFLLTNTLKNGQVRVTTAENNGFSARHYHNHDIHNQTTIMKRENL